MQSTEIRVRIRVPSPREQGEHILVAPGHVQRGTARSSECSAQAALAKAGRSTLVDSLEVDRTGRLRGFYEGRAVPPAPTSLPAAHAGATCRNADRASVHVAAGLGEVGNVNMKMRLIGNMDMKMRPRPSRPGAGPSPNPVLAPSPSCPLRLGSVLIGRVGDGRPSPLDPLGTRRCAPRGSGGPLFIVFTLVRLSLRLAYLDHFSLLTC